MAALISFRTYAIISLLATLVCIAHQINQKKVYYAVMIELATSKVSMTVLGNMAMVAAMLFGTMMRQLFLGSLRAAELDRLFEKIWFAITETCLALTIFRDELRFRFIFFFTFLLFVKVFHWLLQFRVDQLHTELSVSRLTQFRIVCLMFLLIGVDSWVVVYTVRAILRDGPSFLLLFAFEFIILTSTAHSILLKYLFYVIDIFRNGRWANKAVYTFYLNLLTDLFQLFVYLTFFSIVFAYYGMPLHIVRELYSTFGNFRKRIADFIRYRRVIVNMNTRFPTASNADLADMDRTCIVCREEMHGAGMNAPTHLVSKKLPCGHIFHFDCLRSWLEDNTTCPTCRGPVEPPPTPTHRPVRGTPQRGPVIPQTPEARQDAQGRSSSRTPATTTQPQDAAGRSAAAAAAAAASPARGGGQQTPEQAAHAAASAAAAAAAEAHLKAAMGSMVPSSTPATSAAPPASPLPPLSLSSAAMFHSPSSLHHLVTGTRIAAAAPSPHGFSVQLWPRTQGQDVVGQYTGYQSPARRRGLTIEEVEGLAPLRETIDAEVTMAELELDEALGRGGGSVAEEMDRDGVERLLERMQLLLLPMVSSQVSYLKGVYSNYLGAPASPANTPVRRMMIARELKALETRLGEVEEMVALCKETLAAMGGGDDDAGVSRRIGFSLPS